MANYRNEFEFRSGLLDALGVEHSEADAKNEERWRAKMLDGLEVEYNQNDVNQFDLFRAKLVEGVENYSGGGSGGGGSSDFSTAEVTLVNSANTNLAVMLPVLYEADPPFDPNALVRGALSLLANETLVLNVPLYKGHCLIKKGVSGDRIDGQTVATTYTVTSGSATSSMDGVDITGDCTITIS